MMGNTGTGAHSVAKIVNLRQARKRRERADKARRAAENRAEHGRSKAEQNRDATERERGTRDFEGHMLDKPED